MIKMNLAGEWLLRQDGKEPILGRLPGCNYLDYMENGMDNPFWGENETKANELARHDYRYSREFELSEDELKQPYLELVADGLDTLCTITINGRDVGKTDNINRVWRLDVKKVCKMGKNSIDIDFANTYKAIEEKQKENPMPKGAMPIPGVGQLRKTPCHFGWDWGPKLPPVGIARSIGLEAYSVRVKDLYIRQLHKNGTVTLNVSAQLSFLPDGAAMESNLVLIAPDGVKTMYPATVKDSILSWIIQVDNPRLWWCNGLGEQPLYGIDITVLLNGMEIEQLHRKIGLRTIELDTAPDDYGHQFRFIVNGVPIFAKGADWIPPDSFITRADRETMYFYVKAAKRANMNMLRVWGGGMFENDDFYDACDENGILVWQDFIFACNPYPLDNKEYLENVHAEVIDNVRRLRHRASLALWCGNNEVEVVLILKPFKKLEPLFKQNLLFYHNTLRDWVDELDGVTAYWPGSPSSGSLEHRVHTMKKGQAWGDTHLWHIWHGMQSIEAFRDFPTRFCSEYGMETMPSMHTIRTFTNDRDPELFSPVMQLHQKSSGGNEKILYYLLAKYRNPAKFEDFVYLSQLVQANTVRFATDCWRRNITQQNGALFWQLNDCWPVASWAGIDYEKQLKAVIYQARHFNKMLCLSNDYFDDRAELYIVNEYPNTFSGKIEWSVKDFHGTSINSGSLDVSVGAVASLKAVVLKYKDILNGRKKNDAVLEVKLIENGKVMDEKYWLLVSDKNALLPKVTVQRECNISNNIATVTLKSNAYARYVYVEAEGVTATWSDNYFDIPAGQSITLNVVVPEGMTAAELYKKLRIKTLTDVEPKNSLLVDKWLRIKMVIRNKNYLSWLAFKTLLK